MKSLPPLAASHGDGLLVSLFAGSFGAFLGLSFLKFGNPPIMEKWVVAPTNGFEFLLGFPWPITWAYWLLGFVTLVGLMVVRSPKPGAPRWLLALPMVWLVWQLLAGTQTVDASLTSPTLCHFVACTVCFYLGFFALSRLQCLTPFWLGLLSGFLLVLAIGWDQHFGGLQQTRDYFMQYVYPGLKEVPPGYLKKISSTRIFSTLFYANTLAGLLLLLLPLMLAVIGAMRARFTAAARGLLIAIVGIAALACLFWSGSKGGWLLMLLLGLIALLRLPFSRRFKVALLAGVLVLGLAGFFLKYSVFFRQGATSVVARFDYWQAACRTAAGNPLFGTGPGTFSIPYQKIKRPESEMARLVHNDYLEQASDSGVVGGLVYAVFIVGTLVRSFRRVGAFANWIVMATWLGLLGWALQGLFEFGLYIPALAWPAFAFMGWLLGHPDGMTEPSDWRVQPQSRNP